MSLIYILDPSETASSTTMNLLALSLEVSLRLHLVLIMIRILTVFGDGCDLAFFVLIAKAALRRYHVAGLVPFLDPSHCISWDIVDGLIDDRLMMGK